MLRYRADIRSLGIIATYYGLVVLFWFLPISHPLLIALAVVITCMFSWFCATITHNTVHTPVFRSRTLNRIFQVVLTLSYGFPVSEYVPGHNLSHHRYAQKRRDVMRTTKARHQWNLLNAFTFFFNVAGDVTTANMRYVREMKTRRPRWFRQYLIETTMCWGVKLALVIIDWRKAILFYVIPHLFALWGITSVNFVQHDGCDEDSEFNHSRDFVSPILNWFTCNNGYHAIHHHDAAMHWSLRPQKSAEILYHSMHPALIQKSLFVYLWKAFISPGERVRFDGRPYILPDEGPDEEWFTPTDQPEAASLGAEG